MTFLSGPTMLRRLPKVAIAGALVAVTLSCADPAPDDYHLEIRYVGTPPSGATLASFKAAYARINTMVTASLSPVNTGSDINLEDDCGLAGADVDVPQETHTGIIVYIKVTAIDGVNGTLGSAGPCLLRPPSGNDLPVLGVMSLDEADVANLQASGRLATVVHHELLHVLGLGTLWADVGLLSGDTTVDARFLGSRARSACANLHGGGANCATNVPVHSDTSATAIGSSYAHWRESLFTNELMTPFLGAGATPYSAMTVESMADLGYEVSTAGTDAFTVSGTLLRMAPDADTPQAIVLPEPMAPRHRIDELGRVVPYRRQ